MGPGPPRELLGVGETGDQSSWTLEPLLTQPSKDKGEKPPPSAGPSSARPPPPAAGRRPGRHSAAWPPLWVSRLRPQRRGLYPRDGQCGAITRERHRADWATHRSETLTISGQGPPRPCDAHAMVCGWAGLEQHGEEGGRAQGLTWSLRAGGHPHPPGQQGTLWPTCTGQTGWMMPQTRPPPPGTCPRTHGSRPFPRSLGTIALRAGMVPPESPPWGE